ncbi:MAG: hypothetical protein ACYDBQ_01635 [Thermoplasmatota archaeon]
MEGPFGCLLIRSGKASEGVARLGFHGAEVEDQGGPVPVIPYSEMTEVWHYGPYVHVRYPDGEARFDVGDRRRCKRIARMIEDAPSPLEALGARKGDLVAVMGLPEGWVVRLVRRRHIMASASPAAPAGLLVVGLSNRRSLAGLSGLKAHMKEDGALWVVYPSDGADVRTDEVVEAGRGLHLKDVLELRVAPGRTALKFVAG